MKTVVMGSSAARGALKFEVAAARLLAAARHAVGKVPHLDVIEEARRCS